MGAWTVCRFKERGGEGWQERGSGAFKGEGGCWYPNAHYAPDAGSRKLPHHAPIRPLTYDQVTRAFLSKMHAILSQLGLFLKYFE